MKFDPVDMQNFEFKKRTKPSEGSVVEGVLVSIAGHVAITLISFGFALLYIAVAQWIYLLPLFIWLRHKDRFESAQGLFFGAAIGCGINAFVMLMLSAAPFH